MIGLARIVGLIALEPDHGILQGQEPEAQIGTALAMHVVAAKPLFLSRELVPQTVIRRETIAFRSQVALVFLSQNRGSSLSIHDFMEAFVVDTTRKPPSA